MPRVDPPDITVMTEFRRGPGQDRPPVFHHQATLGGLEGQRGVLLDKQNAKTPVPETQEHGED
jgi:hypothetical protein